MTGTSDTPWQLPATWAWAEFGEVAAIAQDLVDPKLVPHMPHIAPNNIEGGSRRLLAFQTVEDDGVISPKQRFFPGQVVFSKIRPYLRKAILADFEGVCSADMYPIWPSLGLQAKYLLYWLTADDFRNIAAPHQGRTLLPKINQAGLNSTPLPLPPLAEQERIVAKLDTLTARTARARADLDRVLVLADRQRRAVLSAAFSAILDRGDAAGTWARRSVHSLIDGITGGKNLRCEERPPNADELGVVKVSAVSWGRFDPEAAKTLPPAFSPAAKTLIRDGDLLISRANTLELVGAVALVEGAPDNLYLSDKVLRLEMPEGHKRWLMWFLRSPQGRAAIESRATGNQLSMRNLSQDGLRAIDVPWPDAEVRSDLVDRIEATFAKIDGLVAEAAAARRLLDRLEQAFLAKAFRGELVSQEPGDEPTDALLARIRAERAAAPVKPDRGRRAAA